MMTLPFGFRILGSCHGEHRLVVHAALLGYASCDTRAAIEREAYLSAFTFGPDFRELLESTAPAAASMAIAGRPGSGSTSTAPTLMKPWPTLAALHSGLSNATDWMTTPCCRSSPAQRAFISDCRRACGRRNSSVDVQPCLSLPCGAHWRMSVGIGIDTGHL